jgi:hypothetical protein
MKNNNFPKRSEGSLSFSLASTHKFCIMMTVLYGASPKLSILAPPHGGAFSVKNAFPMPLGRHEPRFGKYISGAYDPLKFVVGVSI